MPSGLLVSLRGLVNNSIGEDAAPFETDLKRQALDLNYAFAPLLPLVKRARLLCFNAQTASTILGHKGKPFAMVIRELSSVSERLGEQLLEVQRNFGLIVQHTVRASFLETQRRIFTDAVALAEAQSGDIRDPRRLGGIALLRARAAIKSPAIEEEIQQMQKVLRRLGALIDRIHDMAVRQVNFIAVTASVEGARPDVNETALLNVAQDIVVLAQDLSNVERVAREKVEGVVVLVTRYLRERKRARTPSNGLNTENQ